ncbi:RIO1 family-domain-containing protein [Lipomyces japonicus]|uniref:RIO1 family-domain-containing protein n=1 Tax=Lipomyces japonicus TaxID=56871 RepID=UPI0034CFD9BE
MPIEQQKSVAVAASAHKAVDYLHSESVAEESLDSATFEDSEDEDDSDFDWRDDDVSAGAGVSSNGQRKGATAGTLSGGKKLPDDNAILAKYASRIKVDQLVPVIKNKLTDKSDRATIEQVLDPRTCKVLAKFINKGELDEINGCISTGKEANVYHAITQDKQHRAIKIYKTSILVFKDRDRYVTGEYRFRHGYSRHNPRKMVKLWAEKEMRNLNRLFQAGIPSPKPLALKLHVLVMDFVGDSDGWASPRLHDAKIEDDKYIELYHQLVAYMIIMYHKCRLVHADLSEYNILYHEGKLVIIDVSQSVEHDHPHSFEFLRMDIKNVNDFFAKHNVVTFSDRQLFSIILNPPIVAGLDEIIESVSNIEPDTSSGEVDEAVFRQMYIPQTLEQVYDVERDVAKIKSGEGHDLVYKDLVQLNINDRGKHVKREGTAEETGSNNNSEEDDDDEADEEDEDEDEDRDDDSYEERPRILKGKKYESKDDKKERKKQVKEDKKEKRAKKMPKHVKKKLVNGSKRR